MEIEVRLYATFRDLLPEGPYNFSLIKDVREGTTLKELSSLLNLPEEIPKIFVVRGSIVDENYVLKEGDIVSIFPPIAGG
jgi:molybdopterin converting factor small subunit